MLDFTRYVAIGSDFAQLPFAEASKGPTINPPKIQVENVDFWYGDAHALKSIKLEILSREVTAFIGRSGCGKSTLLKGLNRMQDDVREHEMTGRILLDGEDIHSPEIDPPMLRARFGWVAQKPNPFPWTVYENIAYAPQIHGKVQGRAQTDEHVENCLRRAGLWDEMKDRLGEAGTDLSGGQQQRLCIARALSLEPEVLLMDEPCGSLDPVSTATIEDLIRELTGEIAIVIITHNMEQAARVAQRTAFFKLGEMLEVGDTKPMFQDPQSEDCRSYLQGQFG
ncbi:MAG: phosphate ABC transporter ATP-binding protein [Neomegalonema sp.]